MSIKQEVAGVLDGRRFLGKDDFVIWDCHTEGRGVFDGKLHFHDFYEMSFVYDGEGVYSVNGHTFDVKKGFVLLTTPSDYHMLTVKAGETLRYYNVIFRESVLSKAVSDECYQQNAPLCYTVEDLSLFSESFRLMLADFTREAVDPIPPLTAILVKNAIETLAVRILKEAPHGSDEKSPAYNDTMRHALLYIREHYREKLTLSRVAEAVALSPGYFSGYFSKIMRIGFSEYLLHYRLVIAAGYITSTNLPLKTVAAMNGFSSFTYFSAAFSDYFGTSPREYRKTMSGGRDF